MDTPKLKAFSKNARIQLREGVKNKLLYWGFDDEGQVIDAVEKTSGGYIFRGKVFDDESVPGKWKNLRRAIQRHTVDDIVEEAAYTWFNRIIAIKILEENGYDDPILRYASKELEDPIILHNARKGLVQHVKKAERKLVNSFLLAHDEEEAFGLLLICYCKGHRLLNQIFGNIDDYTELLLPNNLLASGSIIDLLNSNEYISEDDYKQVELIGWLYQFYISDKKDEVFAGFKKNKKARPEDIPAATQIFTPKWIVKYMVENTVGRIWLDRHPESPIRDSMKYLVVPSDENQRKSEPIISDVTELKLLDPACGSGHILVVGFDLLLKMYREEGYTSRHAVEAIINQNLYGIDIDKRAAQLANFAVLMKAASYDSDILKKDINPNVYAMPEPHEFSRQDVYDFLGEESIEYANELEVALKEMQLAKNIGSALALKINKEAQDYLKAKMTRFEKELKTRYLDLSEQALHYSIKPYIEIILLLTIKYPVIVMNPPYLGYKYYNSDLKKYLEENYPHTKKDLFAVFMKIAENLMIDRGGKSAIINQWSWMCLDSYKNYRKYFLKNLYIDSLLFLGIGVFPELNTKKVQSVSLVFSNRKSLEKGIFFKLDETFSDKTKEKMLLNSKKLYYIDQNEFLKIKEHPFSFWLSETILNNYSKGRLLNENLAPKQGLATGDNKKFLRYWYEINIKKIGFYFESAEKSTRSSFKWFPYNKGGGYRRWYGNQEYLINWEDNGREIRNFKDKKGKLRSVIRNEESYFKEGITWSLISLTFSVRYSPAGFIFDVGGSSGFPLKEILLFSLALLNSKVSAYLLYALNYTLNVQIGDIKRILWLETDCEAKKKLDYLTAQNIKLSKYEWDSHETSWNFKIHLLIQIKQSTMKEAFIGWEKIFRNVLSRLHSNEEEINKIFINLYGLEDSLSPYVSLKDIAILQDELDFKEHETLEEKYRKQGKDAIELPIKKGEVVHQLSSYTVGCFMGRYRLNKPGLNIAHPGPNEEELSSYTYNGHSFEIDEDGIIPMMGSDSPFSDDIVNRVKKFIHIVWGEATLTENLNFINEALGMALEKFLTQKFWNYHKKMYKKKPIYWLFSSPNESFKVLVYMHRMNRFTVQKIRNNYMQKQLEYLSREIGKLKKNEANLTKAQARQLDKLRTDELECREYDLKLKEYADKQIEFDLDDGVSVNYEKFKGIVAKI